MALYITVDGGTTNTRLYFVRDGNVTDTCKLSIGIRAEKAEYRAAIRNAIAELLKKQGVTAGDIAQILASGMITSEYGLCHLPHVTLPTGKRELHASMHREVFADISEIPWSFIRGARVDAESFADTDMMRGEETEVVGLFEQIGKEALYILPGSHSKHITVDAEGRITGLRTMMSGELFAAVMQHTILRDAADFTHNTILNADLEQGYTFCRANGINEALFKTRILQTRFGASPEACYSFLLGVILCDEVQAILNSGAQNVVIGGQAQFKHALAHLLTVYGSQHVEALSDAIVNCSVTLGAVKIYEAE